MKKPVRTTLVFGLLSGAALFAAVPLLANPWGWSLALRTVLWADLALYTVLLARWSRTPPSSLLLPLCILLGAALWPGAAAGFFLLALGVLSWLRSGICFRSAPLLRRITAEVVSVVGGAALVAIWTPGSALAWALGIWLFFLAQALYFFIMPGWTVDKAAVPRQDPFETARREAETIMEG